jgi:filamentous hemagglutinin family protein
MNHIYRLVWSQLANAWIAVAENARGHGKSIAGRKLVAAALALAGGALSVPSAYAANAADATVTGGAGSVSQSGATTIIHQGSQRLAIDWTNLSTAANEALVFNQPNASAIALNRITGANPSNLLGSLTANGQVFILNPNGVLFGAGAQVNVGGLVASTLTMSSADFMNGSSTFTAAPNANGQVVNQGTINSADGGYVALIGATVRNEGNLHTRLGTTLLAAGDKVTLNLNNGSLLGYSIDQGALNALAENRQLIEADGGQVLMSAKAANALTTAVVNNTGVIEARTVENQNGRILLMGDMDAGTVNVGGTLDASAAAGNGDGGFVETSAAHVNVANGTRVTTQSAQGKTGTWLIDPNDFTIAASGGNMTGADVAANLNMNNFEIETATMGTAGGNGDIDVNDAVTWNAATTLTLTAQRNININQSITAQDANGKLALEYGQGAGNNNNAATYNVNAQVNLQAGNNFSTKLGSDGPTIQYQVITDLGSEGSTTGTDLQGMNGSLNGNYVLGADIDASATAAWESGAGFAPVGDPNASVSFVGIFDGLGHTISNLTIDRPADSFIGLFGGTIGATIRNISLVGGSMTGGLEAVGSLIGLMNGGSVENAHTSSVVSGEQFVGGLVGWIDSGTIDNASATGDVTGTNYVGGLIGYNQGGAADNVSAAGNVDAGSLAGTSGGGLIGVNEGDLSNASATGNVTGYYAGGLVGSGVFNGASITTAHASGNVSGTFAGGLAGEFGGDITDAHATGTVTALDAGAVGGLVGQFDGNTLNTSDASGLVTGDLSEFAGGLIGDNSGTVENSSAIGNVTGNSGVGNAAGGLIGISTGKVSNASASGNVTGYYAGGLIGKDSKSISNSSATGNVTGYITGGLIGYNGNGAISGSHASGVVTGLLDGDTGGLVGNNSGAITTSYATGNVTGGGLDGDAGGLVGEDHGGVGSSYASGDVVGYNAGGLVGNGQASIKNSNASGAVTGYYAGGLIGEFGGDLTNSYATGNVTGNVGQISSHLLDGRAGGLIGYGFSGTVDGSYATGNVSGPLDGAAGGLMGYNSNMGITNSFAGGSAAGFSAGGLIGFNDGGTLNNVHAGGAATGTGINNYAGGLVGQGNGDITNAYATGVATGHYTGGLAGEYTSTISNSYATGNVFGDLGGDAGGLVGYSVFGTINNSYATGNVSSQQTSQAGGLVGYAGGFGSMTDIYATGNVSVDSGAGYAGGIVGYNDTDMITNAYASGSVTGVGPSNSIGGVAGYNGYNISASFWNKEISGNTVGSGRVDSGANNDVTGLTNVQASKLTTYTNAGWDMGATGGTGTIWRIYDGQTGPMLRSFMTAITVTGSATDKTYDGLTTTASGYTSSITDAMLDGSLVYTEGSKNVGSYSSTGTGSHKLTQSGLYSGQQGYDISYAAASLTVDKADLTVTAQQESKTYDGTVNAAGSGNAGALAGAGDRINSAGSQTFLDKNAGDDKTVRASGVTIKDASGANMTGNYDITYVDNTAGVIDQASLTVTAQQETKTYDGAVDAAGSGIAGALAGAGDSIDSAGSQAFLDKNAGTGKSVRAGGVTIKDASGADMSGNYDITYVDNTASTIDKADLTVTANGVDKVYDGLTNATVSYGDNRIAGDVLDITGNANFADQNAGNGKTVTVGDMTLGGADAGNYALIGNSVSTTADITPASLTVTANGADKFYDGIAYAGGNGVSASGFVNGETDALLAGMLGYSGASQGATAIGNYTITPGGLNAGSNYTITFINGTLVINPVSQASAALGGSLLESAYNGVELYVDDAGAKSGKSDQADQTDKANDAAAKIASVVLSGRGNRNDASQPTPRLSVMRCGVQLPAGVNAGCQ